MEKVNNIICIPGMELDSNVYVVGDIIFDTGTGEHKEYLFSQLKEAGVNLPDQLTEENLKSLFIEPKTNQSKEIGKSTKTEIADMIDSLKNNKFFKFLACCAALPV